MQENDMAREPRRGTESGRRGRRTLRWVAAGALAVGLAGAGGATVMAASNGSSSPSPSPSASPSTGTNGSAQHARHHRRAGWFGAAWSGASRAPLHGEAVVPTKNGTRTLDVQRGSITAVSATSVTIRSTDGFAATYTLDSSSKLIAFTRASGGTTSPTPAPSPSASGDQQRPGKHRAPNRATITAAELKVGDRVAVTAMKSGSTTTVEHLVKLPAAASTSSGGTTSPVPSASPTS